MPCRLKAKWLRCADLYSYTCTCDVLSDKVRWYFILSLQDIMKILQSNTNIHSLFANT